MADQKQPGGPPDQPMAGSPPPPYTEPPPQGYPPQGPPPPGQPVAYPPQPAYGATTVVVQPVGPSPGSTYRYRNAPALVICQHCNAHVTTTMTYETGLLTWAAAGVICLFGCWLGCYLIPFCIDATKDVTHTCPNCQQMVGKFRQIN